MLNIPARRDWFIENLYGPIAAQYDMTIEANRIHVRSLAEVAADHAIQEIDRICSENKTIFRDGATASR